MGRTLCALGVVGLMGIVGVEASGALVAPSGWSRGAADTTYQEWNSFTSAGGPNAPDVGVFFNPNATAQEQPNVFDTLPPGSSFVTSGGNIYSPSAAIRVDVDVPHYGYGAGYTTTVLVQARTIGSELDYGAVRLTYDGASAPLLPVERVESDRVPFPGFGGVQVDNLFRFEVPFSPSEFKVHLDAAASSMSLDRVVVDTRTATALPEPGVMGVAGLAWVGGLLRRRRRGLKR